MQLSLLSLAAVLSLATAQGVPDKPIPFWGQLFFETNDCTTGEKWNYLSTVHGNCTNRPMDSRGSFVMKIGEANKNYLSGWTGPNCTGRVVVIGGSVGTCETMEGVEPVLSWSNDLKPFGNPN